MSSGTGWYLFISKELTQVVRGDNFSAFYLSSGRWYTSERCDGACDDVTGFVGREWREVMEIEM
jgi:hypothetical protein